MSIIRLIDKQSELVVQEEVKHDANSLQPLPRTINREDKIYRFEYYFGPFHRIAVYKESGF